MYLWLQKSVGGTLFTDELDERPDASPTFSVLSPSGGSLATGTGTVDAVSTTLNGAVAAGATTVVVASAASIFVGRRYRIGGAESVGGEVVTVKSIATTTITLVRPLVRAAASGATFDSSRISITVTAAACATIGRHHRIEITYLVGAVARPTLTIPFDVTRYGLKSGLTFEHVRDLDPLIAKRMGAGMWWPAIREASYTMILTRIAAKVDPGGLVGTIELQMPHAYAAMALILDALGSSDEETARKTWVYEKLQSELDATLGAAAIDANQDGAVTANEQWFRSIPVIRG